MYQKKYWEEKHADLSLIKKQRKKHYLFVKELNTFMCNHTLPCKKIIFAVVVCKLSVQEKY